MKRAGGWTLGLVAVLGMATAAFLGFRPILFRKPLILEFVCSTGWKPQDETAVRQAFAEREFRARGGPIQPLFTQGPTNPRPTGHVLTISRTGDLWEVTSPSTSPTLPDQLELLPDRGQIGIQTAVWAQKKGIARVFTPSFLNFDLFVVAFKLKAKSLGVDCRTDQDSPPQGRSLVDEILASHADLVLLRRDSECRGILKAVRERGHAARILLFDGGTTFPNPPSSEEEDCLIVSRFAQSISGVTGRHPTSPILSADYFGYLMATLALDALDQGSSDDPREVYRRLAQSPVFNGPDGRASLPGEIYDYKHGILQKSELLK